MGNNDKLENGSSLKDMQAYFGVSREAILGWIYIKKMPAHKLGRLWKFKISEVDQWIASGNAASDAENESSQIKKKSGEHT